MQFFNWSRWVRSRQVTRLTTVRNRPSRRLRPGFETLEDRTLLSSLPAPVVIDGSQDSFPFTFPTNNPALYPLIDAQIAVNPLNPNKLVAVASYDTTDLANSTPGIRIWYSANA